jgi:RTX calcium-binding nonapeptide repeat (4 copies)
VLRLAAVLAFAAALALPASASADYTSADVLGAIAMSGNAASDELIIGEAGGLLRHNRFSEGDPLFNSDFDFDTDTAGDQTFASTANVDLLVSAGDGDDTISFTTEGIGTAALNGDLGDDDITGTNGEDGISGQAGDDELTGGLGNDTLDGGPDGDTFVWNPGDGDDRVRGDGPDSSQPPLDGIDTFVANGSDVAGDDLSAGPGDDPDFFEVAFDADVTPDRTEIERTERLVINGRGGDDTITGAAGLAGLAVLEARGGLGEDTFEGSDGPDTFFGGPGNDTGTGNAGVDVLDGGDDDDDLFARDSAADSVICGGGTDTAQTDQASLDSVTGCETVDASPEPTPATVTVTNTVTNTVTVPGPAVPVPVAPGPQDRVALPLLFNTPAANLSRNLRSFVVSIACPRGEAGGCRVDLDVTTRSPFRFGLLRIRVLLATLDATLRPGETRAFRLSVPAGIQGLFGTRRSLQTRVLGDTTDASGNVSQVAANLTLRLPRARARTRARAK